jgi:hypothetical protein
VAGNKLPMICNSGFDDWPNLDLGNDEPKILGRRKHLDCYPYQKRRRKTSGDHIARTTEPDHDTPNVGLEKVARGDAREPPDNSAPGAAA